MVTIFLTLCGIYTLFTGRLLSIFAGGRGLHVTGSGARMAGAILALAFPLTLLLRLALPALVGDSALMFGAAIEIGVAVLVLAASFVTSRRAHRVTVSA